MDPGFSHRIRTSRTAEVCRLCLKKRYLVDINANQYLRMQLLECFPHCTPEDSELPQFVCGECYQLIDITYQFSVRTRRTEVLLRSYVHLGGDFPKPETLEAEYRRTSKRSASPEKQEEEEKRPHKKPRTSGESSSSSTEKKESRSSKHKDNKERTSSKRAETEDSSKHKERKERTSLKRKEKETDSSSKRKEKDISTDSRSKRSSRLKTPDTQLKQYYRSDVFLFGEKVEETKDSSKHKERKERTSSNHKEKETDSSKRKEKDISTDSRSKRSSKPQILDTQLNQYYRSDEFLFGEKVEFDQVEQRIDSIEDSNVDVTQRTETIADNLPGMSLKMSYNEMLNVLKTIETIQNNQLVSV